MVSYLVRSNVWKWRLRMRVLEGQVAAAQDGFLGAGLCVKNGGLVSREGCGRQRQATRSCPGE